MNLDGLTGEVVLTFSPLSEFCIAPSTSSILVYESFETMINDSICQGDTLIWNTQEYFQTGSYTQNFESINGCDSIVVLELNVRIQDTIELMDFEPICSNAAPIELQITQDNVLGQWDGPGVENNVFNPEGLNGEIELVFNPQDADCINPTIATVFIYEGVETLLTDSICQGDTLFWNGLPYFSEGVFNQNFSTVLGCDSIVQLELNVVMQEPVDLSFIPEMLCTSSQPIELPLKVDSVCGTWVGDGIIGNTFYPEGLIGDAVFSFLPDEGECAEGAIAEIEFYNFSIGATVVPSASGLNNGAIEIFVENGVEPYQFVWSDPNIPPVSSVVGLSPGEYTVTVIDDLGCSLDSTLIIDEITSTLSISNDQNNLLFFPNPFERMVTVFWNSQQIKKIELLTIAGESIQSFKVNTEMRMELDLESLASGVYVLVSKDKNGNSISTGKIVKQ